MKIIPSIDILEGNVVRLVKGDPSNKIVYSGEPLKTALKLEEDGADMLHVVDLDAALGTNHKNNIQITSGIIESVKIPVQVAGGIRSSTLVEEMFNKKASKVVLGTLAYKEPGYLKEIAKTRSRQVIISVDHIDGTVMMDGWREKSGFDIAQAMDTFTKMGFREFLLTSINKDGTLTGPDTETLSYAATLGDSKIIASGGISSLMDVIRVRVAGCSSVILGRALYDGKIDIRKAKAIA